MNHIITNDGYEFWKNEKNQFHREDGGPAVIWGDGSERWWKNNRLHREKDPSAIYFNDYEEWYQNGNLIIK